MLKKIKALFTLNKTPQQMEVNKAIITRGKVLLKPAGSTKTVTIKANEVDIIINNLNNIDEDCFRITDNLSKPSYKHSSEYTDIKDAKQLEKKNGLADTLEKNDVLNDLSSFIKPLDASIKKKKIMRLSLYPDEYEMINEMVAANGFKRTEFLLACVSSSKKQSFMSEYKRYTNEHKLRRLEEREAVHQTQEALRDNNIQ